MSRIIQFPNDKEQRLLKRQKFVQKRQNFLDRVNAFVKNFFFKIAYGLIVLLANVLHYVTTIFFYVSYFFRKPILFVLYGMCVVAYSYLGQKFMIANDMSIPVLLLTSVLILSSEKIVDKIQMNMPFHRLLRCKIFIDENEQSGKTEYILLERSD